MGIMDMLVEELNKNESGATFERMHSRKYRMFDIEYNLYGQNEYTVQVDGDDVWFTNLAEAEKYVEELERSLI